jgi:hypothetical protein
MEWIQYACPSGFPSGGIYSGNGIAGNFIFTEQAGFGLNTVYYTYTDIFGCTNTDSTIVEIIDCYQEVSIENLNNESAIIQLFPNPNNGEFSVMFNFNLTSLLSIYSMNGKLVFQKTTNSNKTEIIQAPHLPTGIYFLTVENEKLRKHIKFIIQP